MPARRTTTRPAWASITRSARKHPASLLENPVGARVELAHGFVDAPFTARGPLGDELHFVGDAFPFRHLGRRLHALELIAKRPRVDVGGERRIVPCAAPGRQIAGLRMKAALDVRTRQIFDELPR